MKKIIRIAYCLLIALFVTILGTSFFMRNIYEPEAIIKESVKENELTGKSHILCQRVRITGFDWILIKNENGKITREYCNVIGAKPFYELKLRHEFLMAGNTIIFYIEENKMSYTEVTNQDEIEYYVSGWDVLYPVKHSELLILDLYKSKKYITKDDLWE